MSALWIFAEFTAGFLIVCLPVLPRFYKSLVEKQSTSGFDFSLPSFLRVLKLSNLRKSGNQSDSEDDSKLWNNCNRTQPAKLPASSDVHDMNSTSIIPRNRAESSGFAHSPQNRKTSLAIMRSTNIVTTFQPAHAMA